MSTSQSIRDVMWRVKLYVGSALLGAGVGAVIWPMYVKDFPDKNLTGILRVVSEVFEQQPVHSWLFTGACACLFFWIVWSLVAQPWRDSSERPKGAAPVKKPW
jgi:hypothetical protein